MTKVAPLVSVIMSVYKEPIQWIQKSTGSILNQTFRQFEFIIINDNPTDCEIKNILQSYKNKDSRICILENYQNLGLIKSLNRGIKHSRGKYIARMDADDISVQTRLEEQYNFMLKNPHIGVVGSWIKYFGRKSGVKKYYENDYQIKAELILSSPIAHPAAFIRRDIIFETGIFYSDEVICHSVEDYKLWCDLALSGFKFSNIQKVLLYYRVSNKQVSFRTKGIQIKNAQEIRKLYINNLLIKYGIQLSFKDSKNDIKILNQLNNTIEIVNIKYCIIFSHNLNIFKLLYIVRFFPLFLNKLSIRNIFKIFIKLFSNKSIPDYI